MASFFVSRVDTKIDNRLDKIATPEARALKGKAAIANVRLVRALRTGVLRCRWRALQAAGAHPQRPLWASTGVKDPSYDDTRYVVNLVTRGVVNTMPQATLAAVADLGTIRGDTIRPFYPDAHQVFRDIAAVGVDYDNVVDLLENQGVTKFETSWAAVTAQLSDRLRTTPAHQDTDIDTDNAALPHERAH